MQKYVASSIVVFNLDTRQVKWTADLDLSTDTVNFRAHVYSSPTVVDWMVMDIWTSLLEPVMACFMLLTIVVSFYLIILMVHKSSFVLS